MALKDQQTVSFQSGNKKGIWRMQCGTMALDRMHTSK